MSVRPAFAFIMAFRGMNHYTIYQFSLVHSFPPLYAPRAVQVDGKVGLSRQYHTSLPPQVFPKVVWETIVPTRRWVGLSRMVKLSGVRSPAETYVSPLTNGPYEVINIDCIVHTPGCEESEGTPRKTLKTTIRPRQ